MFFFFIIYSCDNNCLPHKLWSIASAQCDTVWPGKAKFYQTQRLSVKAPCSEWVSAEVKCVSAEGNDRTGFAAHTETKTTDYRSKGSQSGLKHRGVSHRVEWAEDYCLCSTGGEPRALAENLTDFLLCNFCTLLPRWAWVSSVMSKSLISAICLSTTTMCRMRPNWVSFHQQRLIILITCCASCSKYLSISVRRKIFTRWTRDFFFQSSTKNILNCLSDAHSIITCE